MTVKELKKLIEHMNDDLKLTIRIEELRSENEFQSGLCEHPYKYRDVNIVFDKELWEEEETLLCRIENPQERDALTVGQFRALLETFRDEPGWEWVQDSEIGVKIEKLKTAGELRISAHAYPYNYTYASLEFDTERWFEESGLVFKCTTQGFLT